MKGRMGVIIAIAICMVDASGALAAKPLSSPPTKPFRRLNGDEIRIYVSGNEFESCAHMTSEAFGRDGSYYSYQDLSPFSSVYEIKDDQLCIRGSYCRILYNQRSGIWAKEFRRGYDRTFPMTPKVAGVSKCH